LVDQSQMACYLASVAPHSGDWLLALPIADFCERDLERKNRKAENGNRVD